MFSSGSFNRSKGESSSLGLGQKPTRESLPRQLIDASDQIVPLCLLQLQCVRQLIFPIASLLQKGSETSLFVSCVANHILQPSARLPVGRTREFS